MDFATSDVTISYYEFAIVDSTITIIDFVVDDIIVDYRDPAIYIMKGFRILVDILSL